MYGDVVSSLTQNLTAMDAVTASSSFWNVGLVEGTELEYEATKGWLTHYTAVGSSGKDKKVYAMDGGLIDTTGITSHLRTKERSIVSFYNNNDDLRTLNSTIAFLFGSSTSTDTMNALEGLTLMRPHIGKLMPMPMLTPSECFLTISLVLTLPDALTDVPAHGVAVVLQACP